MLRLLWLVESMDILILIPFIEEEDLDLDFGRKNFFLSTLHYPHVMNGKKFTSILFYIYIKVS